MLFLTLFYLVFVAPLGSGKFHACLNSLITLSADILLCFFLYLYPGIPCRVLCSTSFWYHSVPPFKNGFPTTFFDLLLSVFPYIPWGMQTKNKNANKNEDNNEIKFKINQKIENFEILRIEAPPPSGPPRPAPPGAKTNTPRPTGGSQCHGIRCQSSFQS